MISGCRRGGCLLPPTSVAKNENALRIINVSWCLLRTRQCRNWRQLVWEWKTDREGGGYEPATWRLAPPQFLADPFSRDSVALTVWHFIFIFFFFHSLQEGFAEVLSMHNQQFTHTKLAEHQRQDYFPISLHTRHARITVTNDAKRNVYNRSHS